MDCCTLWFDGSWRECCCRHDRRYANKRLTRKQADILLRRCVAKKSVAMSHVMYAGIRLFGWYFYNKINKGSDDELV
jgi:hypothetical protein